MDHNAHPIESDSGVTTYEQVTEYTISAIPPGAVPVDEAVLWEVVVAWRGEDRWAVLRLDKCLAIDGTWDMEPRPSSRTEEWLATHRFGLAEALRRAHAAAPSVTVNGLLPSDAIARTKADATSGDETPMAPAPGIAVADS